MSANSTNLILILTRGGTSPPIPTGCEFYGSQVICDAQEPVGVYDLELALAEHGSVAAHGRREILTNGAWSNQNDGRPRLILGDLNDGTYSVGCAASARGPHLHASHHHHPADSRAEESCFQARVV